MPLYAGVSETNITPPLGVWMSGYASRPTGSVDIHDELYARALVLNDGAAAMTIVSMDLLGLKTETVERVRREINLATGIPQEAILLGATHTHGGPVVMPFNCMGPEDPEYSAILARKLVSVVRQAAGRLHAAELAVGHESVQIGVNRRETRASDGAVVLGSNLAGPVAPYVDVIVVRDLRQRPFAVVLCHPCHGVTLSAENLRTSADWAGYACRIIRKETSGTVTPVLLQGCCGDVNPLDRGTFAAAERNGRQVAEATLEAMEMAEEIEPSPLEYAETSVDLPLVQPASAESCRSAYEKAEAAVAIAREGGNQGAIIYAEGMRDYARYELEIAQGTRDAKSLSIRLQHLKMGEASILGIPMETFVQYGVDIASQSPGPAIVAGYANGVHGYLPTAAAFASGGYEVEEAHRFYNTLQLHPRCEELVRTAAYELLGVSDPDLTPYPAY